jgi:hypothetical protein
VGDKKPIPEMGFFIDEKLKNELNVDMVASIAFRGG